MKRRFQLLLGLLVTVLSTFAKSAENQFTCSRFKQDFATLVEQRQSFDVRILEECIEKHDIPDSQHYIGLVYLLGINTLPDYEQGILHLVDSVNSGNTKSLVALGDFYVINEDSEIFQQGVELLRLAMNDGSSDAVVSLSRLVQNGEIGPDSEIEDRFEKLFEEGTPDAVLLKVRLAIETSIKLNDEKFIEDVAKEANRVSKSNQLIGDVHYMVARAFITEGTKFYNVSRVISELNSAAQFGNEEALKLLAAIESRE